MDLDHPIHNNNVVWRAFGDTTFLLTTGRVRELGADLRQRLRAPVAEPVDHAAVEQRRARGRARVEVGRRRVHREHDV